jgi:exopolysaccharide biosynthesis polyprenyl glycosylphosphotransferase
MVDEKTDSEFKLTHLTSLHTMYRGPRYPMLQAALDVISIIAAWHITLELRLILNPLFALQFGRDHLEVAAPSLISILPLWIIAALWMNLYREQSDSSISLKLLQVVESAFVLCAISTVFTFFFWELGVQLSRSFIILFVPVLFVTLVGARYAAALVTYLAGRHVNVVERIAVVGGGVEALAAAHRIAAVGGMGTSFAGVILPEYAVGRATMAHSDLMGSMKVLGTTSQLAELINRAQLDRLVLVDMNMDQGEADLCHSISNRMGVTLSRVMGLQTFQSQLRVSEKFGLQMLEYRPLQFSRRQELLKRSFDVLFAAGLIILLLPLLLVICAVIKLTSKGPIFYCSTRVGKGGRYFKFLKFRTMIPGSDSRVGVSEQNEKSGHVFKIRNDPRVTWCGRILRRWSLDELPQLVNVLKGDMSLVGPRPLPASDLDPDGQSRRFATWAEQRSGVLPGISGLWQIRGRSDLSFEQMMDLDIEYIRNWSVRFDIQILLATPLKVLTGRGAY